MIADHGTMGFKPTDDYQFVGAMWVRTSGGWYYDTGNPPTTVNLCPVTCNALKNDPQAQISVQQGCKSTSTTQPPDPPR